MYVGTVENVSFYDVLHLLHVYTHAYMTITCGCLELFRKGHLTPKSDCQLNSANYKNSVCGYECKADSLDAVTTFLMAHYRWAIWHDMLSDVHICCTDLH